ncbi:hypothetical protein OYE22_31330 [Streptomyces sp. 71268]|uniref:hypothetical protein n=1 Tax=Streptomyces sp. 71268 TaxID=3002640 RepID=UPI0023F80AD6|nr:hypothetical protein [Streptomyces sp. 71268]WEV29181.1 hypothetical protein OYE22_31330 [Streptomyces sp. 71268]
MAEINIGPGLPAGLDGMRHILLKLTASDANRAAAIRKVAERRAAEWNILFPGEFPDAAPLPVIAATCSERRLHAESEQVFRVITAVGQAVTAAAQAEPLTLVLRRAAALDLPTLRAIPHLVERAALCGAPLRLVLAELDPDGPDANADGAELSADGPDAVPDGFGDAARERSAIRRLYLTALIDRLGVPVEPGDPALATSTPAAPAVRPPSREREALDALRAAASPEAAVAAAIALMRAAFFNTHHDIGVLAAHRLLAEADQHPVLDTRAVQLLLEEWDLGDDPGSVGVDASAVTSADALRSLAHRYLGMVHVFVLDYRTGAAHLRRAADLGPAVVRARAQLLLALLLIKRVRRVPEGFAAADAGLAALAGDTSPAAVVEAAWLHNVKALGHVQLRDGSAAMAEERIAVRLIGKLTNTDATHLKVNLISNISVLKEYARQPEAAVQAWRRFSRRSTEWGDTFFKHHAYREAGLLVAAGDVEQARPLLAESRRLAELAHDDFYGAHMALERGTLLLTADPDQAARAFADARDHAIALGDPYLRALAVVGGAAAAGQIGDAPRHEAAALLEASTSYPEQSARLAAALTDGTDEELRAFLPAPRTKLNRPFATVRLAFPERA